MNPQDFIDWSEPWIPDATEGFRVELLWWRYMTGANVGIPIMEFNMPETRYCAAYFCPDDYSLPPDNEGADVRNEYLKVHLAACEALHTGENIPLEFVDGEDWNHCVHRILWATRFGTSPVQGTPPQCVFDGVSSEDDNEHAMCVMGLRLTGNAATLREINSELAPETYHGLMISDVCKHL